jgi:hypothetical protein
LPISHASSPATRTSGAAPPAWIACSIAIIRAGSIAPCCWSITT